MPPHDFTPQQLLQLSFVRGMTGAALRKIAEYFHDAAGVADATSNGFAAARIKTVDYEALLDFPAYEETARRQLALAAKNDVRIVTYWDEEYPQALREIYNPPAMLFVRGSLLPNDTFAVAVVGTRGMTEYGKRMAETFCRGFAGHGVTVVSGLARGIDSVAHSATLRFTGRTIAVVASGVDVISPQIARQLAEKICRNGAVVSEYKMGVKALPAYFPQRNRIISGMARATLVVESAADGGAMITAGFALDQNRGVFAVPGRAGDPKSAGTNLLIKESRATLATSPADVLGEIGITQKKEASAPPPVENVSLFEKKVLDALSAEPMHIDDIAARASLALSDVLVQLLTLELKGFVRQMAGRMFVREM